MSADELAGGSDPLNGYGLATGLTAYDVDGASAATQNQLALEFFNAVADATPVTIVNTGHSLGGVLARYAA